MAIINIDNFSTTLKLSSQGRGSSPDGNFFPNQATGELELIGVDELPLIDFGSGPVANPMITFDGITLQAIYAFERLIRQTGDEDLRGARPFSKGTFQFAGAFENVYSRKIAQADIPKIRGSGLVMREGRDGPVNRILFGVRSLNNLEPTSQAFYQLVQKPVTAATRQVATPVNFNRPGPIDEMVLVFASTANGDNAGDFDFTDYELIASVRTFGRGFSSAGSTASGNPTLNGFSGGFGVGDGAPTTTANYNLADVYGGSAIAPFDSMAYTGYATPQTLAGFSDGAGGTRSADFSAIISNPDGGSLEQVRAFLDALMIQDTDVDQGVGSFLPKRAEELYTIDGSTLVVGQGIYIEGIPPSDQVNIRFTDNAGTAQTLPGKGDVRITTNEAWNTDAEGWYQFFTSASHNTSDPVTFQNADGVNVSGTPANLIGGEIRFEVSETSLGTTIIGVFEGNGGATFDEVAVFLDPNSPIIRASVSPGAETFLT